MAKRATQTIAAAVKTVQAFLTGKGNITREDARAASKVLNQYAAQRAKAVQRRRDNGRRT